MSLTAEQQLLMTSITERVAEIQSAIRRALPGNAALQREFHVGEPAPTTPAEAVALARALEPVAKENRQLLIGRGIDGAKMTHLASMATTLEKLEAAAPSAPAEVEPKVEVEPKKGKKKS